MKLSFPLIPQLDNIDETLPMSRGISTIGTVLLKFEKNFVFLLS